MVLFLCLFLWASLFLFINSPLNAANVSLDHFLSYGLTNGLPNKVNTLQCFNCTIDLGMEGKQFRSMKSSRKARLPKNCVISEGMVINLLCDRLNVFNCVNKPHENSGGHSKRLCDKSKLVKCIIFDNTCGNVRNELWLATNVRHVGAMVANDEGRSVNKRPRSTNVCSDANGRSTSVDKKCWSGIRWSWLAMRADLVMERELVCARWSGVSRNSCCFKGSRSLGCWHAT